MNWCENRARGVRGSTAHDGQRPRRRRPQAGRAQRPGRWLQILPALLALVLWMPGGGPGTAVANAAPGDREATETAIALGTAFANVAEEALPAVVTIMSERVVRAGGMHGMENSPFREFFDDFFHNFRQAPQREFRQQGLGSGFLVSRDGVILTSNHVVENAEEITVVLADDRELAAEIVGTDPATDVAVIRVSSDDALPYLPLGDSDAIRVGEWVLALGNPFSQGLRGTVTTGIISAQGRSRIGLTDYEDFIQTDAAINPGNSGGPLVNMRGEVIGINTAIVGRSGGNQGVGFAIPINLAKMVRSSILAEGRVVRGWLGVYIGELTEELREAFETEVEQGVLIQQVMEGSPAEAAGLREADIILALDGEPVESVQDLRFRIAAMRPGAQVDVTVMRDGRRNTIVVELGELESDEATASDQPSDRVTDLGLEIDDLNDEYREELGLDADLEGVVVLSVDRGSPAADEGLRPGDVIVEVGRDPVSSERAFRRAVNDVAPGDVLLLTVESRAARRFVAIRLPADN